MRHLAVLTVNLIFSFHFSFQWEPKVAYVIVSQSNYYNKRLAKNLEKDLKVQYDRLGLHHPETFISQERFNISSDWTLTPLLPLISDIIDEQTEWIIFLEDYTRVIVSRLFGELKSYSSKEKIFIGHASYDAEATIIHHFAFHEDPAFFKYPNLGSGLVLSVSLLNSLKSHIDKQLDFHIDPAHEFAMLVYEKENGLLVEHNQGFCSVEGPDCAAYPEKLPTCSEGEVSSIFFAIKTCGKFHKSRAEVVKRTWLPYTSKSVFFSDLEDSNIPTVSLNVPNTEQGHCEKTLAILNYALKEFEDKNQFGWLALVDDDTILSVRGLANLIACYDNIDEPLILGERYRFGAQGFNYPTGGAGILVNAKALSVLARKCTCPRADAPDDMVLGACAHEMGIELVHVPQMHQVEARPEDYAPGRLARNDSVTFHKHWMIDPIKVYQKYFLEEDRKLLETSVKSEL